MGDIKIQITDLTIPNDFKIYYKAGGDVGSMIGVNPYPFDSGYIDYGQIFLGGTTTVDLIGDFNYGQVYWIMVKELNYPERWMVKNIKINSSVIYQSFLNITPTPTPSITTTPSFSRTPMVSSTPSPMATSSVTPSISKSPISSPSHTPSFTPTPTHTPSHTPTVSVSPSRHGQAVTITNMNGTFGIVMVTISGSQVLDVAYNVNPGEQKVGSTLQLGPNNTVTVELSGVTNGESVNINGTCFNFLPYTNILNAYPVDTTSGVLMYYRNSPC